MSPSCFNSLFEMQGDEPIRQALILHAKSFNSLFEMLGSRGPMTVSITWSAFQFSI